MNAIRKRRLVPEVVQTSAMDCGPAALTAFLAGFGIDVSYPRLREAVQTEVDGTSIDALEELAVDLGLEAEQVMIPLDHLLLRESHALPAIVVVQRPDGMVHFVVLWSRHRGRLQVMDPASGRRWPTVGAFLSECHIHRHRVSATEWREWAAGPEFQSAARRRMLMLGLRENNIQELLAQALEDPEWHSLAALDAAIRLAAALAEGHAVTRGQASAKLIQELFLEARRVGLDAIPDELWSASPTESADTLEIRGVVLIRTEGKRSHQEARPPEARKVLRSTLQEASPKPASFLLRILLEDGPSTLILALGALLLASFAVILEALLFRGLLDLGTLLSGSQRLAAAALFLFFLALTLVLDLQTRSTALGLGRRLETRLRWKTLEKIPRLTYRFFSSRPVSDMAERSHATHLIRRLPPLTAELLRTLSLLFLTAAGVAWLDPSSGPLAALSALLAVILPFCLQPILNERELRARVHKGAMSRYFLEALLGLAPIWSHGAEETIRREHEGRLAEWSRAGRSLVTAMARSEAAHLLLGFVLAALIIALHLTRQGESGATLLLVYWCLRLPILGQRAAAVARQIPTTRNVTLRLLEPLTAPNEPIGGLDEKTWTSSAPFTIELRDVAVQLGGREVLHNINLELAPGSQVAVVGPSGAGKSTLLGLLLGWHKPHAGVAQVNGQSLQGDVLQETRRHTAWVDPAVRIWNRSLLANLRYGASGEDKPELSTVLREAELLELLEKLPEGLGAHLGEGGGLVSGGEGQRVRMGRARSRPDARLLLFDEPFRGLDRDTRRRLLDRSLSLWPQATVLCVTHDLAEACRFPRVVVLENGTIVEDGSPSKLLAQWDSRLRSLMDAEEDLWQRLLATPGLRRVVLEQGRLREASRREA